MPLFSDAINAKMAGRAIGAVPLVFFDFAGDPKRMWPGFGTLTVGGYDWDGSGDFGSIEGLALATTDAVQAVTFTLAGVTAEMQSLALGSESLVRGRGVTVPTFDEVIEALPRALPFIIELKTPAATEPVRAAIARHGIAPRVIVAGFDPEATRPLRGAGFALGASTPDVIGLVLPAR